MMPEFLWAFATGLMGSLHCLGMCGPLVVAYSLHLQPTGASGSPVSHGYLPAGLIHHLVYHAGRLATYGFLGALAAGLVRLGGESVPLQGLRSTVTLLAGILMVLFGLVLLKTMPLPFASAMASLPGNAMLSRLIRTRLASRGLASKWMLGFGTGFLPCMLSWAMIIQAGATGSPVAGFLFMTVFGLGTMPVLLFTGLFASLLTLRMRFAGERLAALSVIVMGTILFLKGVTRLG